MTDTTPPGMHRPTLEFIRAQAQAHVAYGWSPSPGTHNREIYWTAEDTATYMEAYRAARAEVASLLNETLRRHT